MGNTNSSDDKKKKEIDREALKASIKQKTKILKDNKIVYKDEKESGQDTGIRQQE